MTVQDVKPQERKQTKQSKQVQEVYIYDAIRTPRGRGRANGTLHEVRPMDLVVGLLETLKERNNLDTSKVDDVVLGVVTPVLEQGMDIARLAINCSTWDENVSGVQLNRFCASGLEAVQQGAERIRSGWDDMIVAGGVESMSRVPPGSDGGAWYDPASTLKMQYITQGVAADVLATLHGFTREDVDRYALESQKRAAKAVAEGYFKGVVPVKDMNGLTIMDTDEYLRPDTTLEGLSQLKPAFEEQGKNGMDAVAQRKYPEAGQISHLHTAGNSSGIVDGAALVLLGSREAGEAQGLKPRGRIVSIGRAGTDPTIMFRGPMPATRQALERAGLSTDDIDLYEVNEAFAMMPMVFMEEMGVPHEKVNVNGGAIALGHPLGATGAMLLGTALDELERRKERYAVVTLCVGGGMGNTAIIERVEDFVDEGEQA